MSCTAACGDLPGPQPVAVIACVLQLLAANEYAVVVIGVKAWHCICRQLTISNPLSNCQLVSPIVNQVFDNIICQSHLGEEHLEKRIGVALIELPFIGCKASIRILLFGIIIRQPLICCIVRGALANQIAVIYGSPINAANVLLAKRLTCITINVADRTANALAHNIAANAIYIGGAVSVLHCAAIVVAHNAANCIKAGHAACINVRITQFGYHAVKHLVNRALVVTNHAANVTCRSTIKPACYTACIIGSSQTAVIIANQTADILISAGNLAVIVNLIFIIGVICIASAFDGSAVAADKTAHVSFACNPCVFAVNEAAACDIAAVDTDQAAYIVNAHYNAVVLQSAFCDLPRADAKKAACVYTC